MWVHSMMLCSGPWRCYVQERIDELYQFDWRSVPKGTYPDRCTYVVVVATLCRPHGVCFRPQTPNRQGPMAATAAAACVTKAAHTPNRGRELRPEVWRRSRWQRQPPPRPRAPHTRRAPNHREAVSWAIRATFGTHAEAQRWVEGGEKPCLLHGAATSELTDPRGDDLPADVTS